MFVCTKVSLLPPPPLPTTLIRFIRGCLEQPAMNNHWWNLAAHYAIWLETQNPITGKSVDSKQELRLNCLQSSSVRPLQEKLQASCWDLAILSARQRYKQVKYVVAAADILRKRQKVALSARAGMKKAKRNSWHGCRLQSFIGLKQ